VTVFAAYARYYDLLYADKDYEGEARYVASLLERHCPGARTLLDLGCGTGRHARALARLGYDVLGVDRSEEMVAQANDSGAAGPANPGRTSFATGDLRFYRAGRTFDAVTALFHVVSYQTANADLEAAFDTARAHLRPGGVFVFDCWYGPAVLTERPSVRVKRLGDGETRVVRLAEPAFLPNENRVDVAYTVLVRDGASGAVEEVRENHCMRYLFLPEIDGLLERRGLRRLAAEEWLTGRAPGTTTWGLCVVAG
jgi:SAM-dependent methyltransferase